MTPLDDSALARPKAAVVGEDAYPGLLDEVAALVQSLARNRAFVDGTKRTALGALSLFLARSGVHLVGRDDDRYAFMLAVATASIDDVAVIAGQLERLTEPS